MFVTSANVDQQLQQLVLLQQEHPNRRVSVLLQHFYCSSPLYAAQRQCFPVNLACRLCSVWQGDRETALATADTKWHFECLKCTLQVSFLLMTAAEVTDGIAGACCVLARPPIIGDSRAKQLHHQ